MNPVHQVTPSYVPMASSLRVMLLPDYEPTTLSYTKVLPIVSSPTCVFILKQVLFDK